MAAKRGSAVHNCNRPTMGTIVATFTADSIQSKVPEPVTMALLGSALIGLGLFGRKRFTR